MGYGLSLDDLLPSNGSGYEVFGRRGQDENGSSELVPGYPKSTVSLPVLSNLSHYPGLSLRAMLS